MMTKVSTAQRVIDEIDALIDEQMRDGEPRTGYDFDDPDFPECRCGLNWHGLPSGRCLGSDTEGPLRSTGVVEVFTAIAQAARQMSEQFAESWSRFAESLEWPRLASESLAPTCVPLETERFHLDQWVASHDWQAETREEPELPDAVSTTAIRATLEDLGWRDIKHTMNTPWTDDGVTRWRRRTRRP